jgi:hypothetical protein
LSLSELVGSGVAVDEASAPPFVGAPIVASPAPPATRPAAAAAASDEATTKGEIDPRIMPLYAREPAFLHKL